MRMSYHGNQVTHKQYFHHFPLTQFDQITDLLKFDIRLYTIPLVEAQLIDFECWLVRLRGNFLVLLTEKKCHTPDECA